MKILNILSEAKFSQTEYAYHATKGEHLRSILKNGLIPNKSTGGYGSEDKSLVVGYSLAPLSGVYFTRLPHDAETICKQTGDAVIIVCEIQPKDAEMDEDRLIDNVINERFLYRDINKHIREFLEKESENYDLDDFTDAHTEKYAEAYAQDIIEHKLYELNPKLVAHVKKDLKNYIVSVVDFIIASEQGHDEDDSGIKMYQEKLTQKLRSMTKDKKAHSTFKVNKTIGFKGSNKIVGVYNPFTRRGWGTLAAFERASYNKVNNPLQLIASNH